MLIHRYPNEFTDEGDRASIPIVEMGVGVSGYTRRWKASSLTALADGATVPSWTDTVAGATLTSNAGKQPVLKTVNGVRMMEFDGVDDEFNTHVFNGAYDAPTNPKAFTAVFRIRTQVADVARGIMLMGGGALEADSTLGQLRVRGWFNGSGTGGGVTTNTGNQHNPVNIGDKFVVMTIVGAHDGLHALSVGKTHVTWPATPGTKGMNAITLGRAGSASYSKMDLVETLVWPTTLTEAEREKIDTGLRLNYPPLTFVG